jgi:hypothetical protein
MKSYPNVPQQVADTSIIEALKKEALASKAFNAVCHVFAFRQRTRYVLTIVGLRQKMKAEGFTFSNEEYAKVLRTLASLGIGQLMVSPRGRIRALKNINITLQSIGQAACGDKAKLEGFKPSNKFIRLVSNPETVVKKPQEPPKVQELSPKTQESKAIKLIVYLGGSPVTFAVPEELSTNEIAGLIQKLRA